MWTSLINIRLVTRGSKINPNSIIEATEQAEQRQASLEKVVAECAKLPPLVYAQRSKEIAKDNGIPRASDLDKAVKDARNEVDEDISKGRKIEYKNTEPWPEPVNGAAVLDEATDIILRHMVIREVDAYACVLWAAHMASTQDKSGCTR